MMARHNLLADYVHTGSEAAFRELVSAYLKLVYSTALRVVHGDESLAEDIAQTVFTDLARKAPALPEKIRLGGWLHRHTCFVARKALRQERRRKARERQAVELQMIQDYTPENISYLASILDECINDLRAEDRLVILLRFFEQLDFRSVGDALGSSEDAARMRLSRALEKLGKLLRRRGVTLSLAGLGFILSTKTLSAAPAHLDIAIANAALSAAAVKGIPFFALLKKACLTRVNVGLATAALLIALAIVLVSPRGSQENGRLLASSLPMLGDDAASDLNEPRMPAPIAVVQTSSSVPEPSAPDEAPPAESPSAPSKPGALAGASPLAPSANIPSRPYADDVRSVPARTQVPLRVPARPVLVTSSLPAPTGTRGTPKSYQPSSNAFGKVLPPPTLTTGTQQMMIPGQNNPWRPATLARDQPVAREEPQRPPSPSPSARTNPRKASGGVRLP